MNLVAMITMTDFSSAQIWVSTVKAHLVGHTIYKVEPRC